MAGDEQTSRSTLGPPLPQQGDDEPRQEQEPAWIALAVLAVVVFFLYLVRGILTPFIVAGVLSYMAAPAVHWIEKRWRLPRFAVVLIFFLVFFVPIGVLLRLMEPVLETETKELATNAPLILSNLLSQLFGGTSVDILGQTIDAGTVSDYLLGALFGALGTPSQAIHVAQSIMGALLDTLLSVILLFYFLLDPIDLGRTAIRFVPVQHHPHWQRVGREVHEVLGRYVRGLVFLVFLMATATWIGLTVIFHLPFALPIALATGFLEIIPFLGPLMAATIAAVVGLSYGGSGYAAGIAIFYLILRELEDQLVMPVVIGRAVELPPAMAIFAVLAGGMVGGALGALLGIPVAAVVRIAFERWRPA